MSLFSGYNDTGPQVPGTSGKIQGAKAPKTIGAEGTTNNTRASECPTSKMDALLREAMLSGMFNVESRAVTKAVSATTTLYLPRFASGRARSAKSVGPKRLQGCLVQLRAR